jgi:cellulose synthase/poly-beta-1,6-N-acetylglucosamine synthase-like glycosyltransferase
MDRIEVWLFWASWALILYTYIGFPALLHVLARLTAGKTDTERSTEAGEKPLPRVAMVVAAYNEAGVIQQKLRNTWAIDYPGDRFQLVVGSDGSADGTNELLAACNDPRLQTFAFDKRRGKISVLNDLMAAVDADIVVMSDANTMFAPDAVRKLVRPFEDPAVGCVSGELCLEQDGGVSGEGLYWKYECWIKRNESRLGFLIGCNGGIFALRRELYERLPGSTVVEDFVISMRVLERGYRVLFEPAARATEPACTSARAEMVRKIRIGAGGFQALGLTRGLLHPRHGLASFAFWGHKVLRWMVPVFLLTAMGANLALIAQPEQVPYAAALGMQFAGNLAAGWAYFAGPGAAPPRWVRPVSYFYLMNFALLCGLWRYLTGTQRVTWEQASR